MSTNDRRRFQSKRIARVLALVIFASALFCLPYSRQAFIAVAGKPSTKPASFAARDHANPPIIANACRPEDWLFANPLRRPFSAEQVERAKAYVGGLVRGYLDKAIKSGRRFGLEIEFKGPSIGDVLKRVHSRVGGEMKGITRFRARKPSLSTITYQVEVPIEKFPYKVYLSETKLDGSTNFELTILDNKGQALSVQDYKSRAAALESLQRGLSQADPNIDPGGFRLQLTDTNRFYPAVIDGQQVNISFFWDSESGTLAVQAHDLDFVPIRNMPPLYAAKVSKEAEIEKQIQAILDAPDGFYSNITHIDGSEIGVVRMTQETSGVKPVAGPEEADIGMIDALELILEPLPHARLNLVEGIMEDLNSLGAEGVTDRNALGIHVNVDVDPQDAPAIGRLITNFDENFVNIGTFFGLHPSRLLHAGQELRAIVDQLRAAGNNITPEEIRAIYASADSENGLLLPVTGYDKIGDGKPTALNIRHALAGRRPAAEIRVFNFDGAETDIRSIVEYSLSEVERAFNP